MSSIQIVPVTEVEDMRRIEDLQRTTWAMTEREIIPARFLHALQNNGACLLGAYDGDKVVGFVLGVLGTVEGLKERIDQVAAARLQMYSAIMGVLPDYQTSGIGYRLKLAQREFALRIGVRLVTWTYDPLESRNGYLNIAKLGAICHRYLRNYHGEMTGINAGLPTDRFYVEWWVTSNRVKSKVSSTRRQLGLKAYLSGQAVAVNEARFESDGLLTPPDDFVRSDNRVLLVEIPAEFQIIKRRSIELAGQWREHTRRLFEHYFQSHYLVTDFVRHKEESGIVHSYYVLTHMDS